MQLGASVYGSDRAAALRFGDALVEAGIDRLWLGDGIFRRPDFALWRGGLEAMTTLAWLNGRHPEVGIGVTAAVLPLRDMDWLAREALTLDHVSSGRFVLAVAAGFWADELAYRGVDPDRRGEVFRRQLADLRARLDGEVLSPPAFSAGGVPLWLAGGDATHRHALDLGLPFQASRLLPDELAPVAAAWFDAGGTTLAHRIYVEVGDDAPDGQQVERHVVSGSPAQLLDALGRFADLGVGDCSMVLGHDDASALATLEVLATEVWPELRSSSGGDRVS